MSHVIHRSLFSLLYPSTMLKDFRTYFSENMILFLTRISLSLWRRALKNQIWLPVSLQIHFYMEAQFFQGTFKAQITSLFFPFSTKRHCYEQWNSSALLSSSVLLVLPSYVYNTARMLSRAKGVTIINQYHQVVLWNIFLIPVQSAVGRRSTKYLNWAWLVL